MAYDIHIWPYFTWVEFSVLEFLWKTNTISLTVKMSYACLDLCIFWSAHNRMLYIAHICIDRERETAQLF